MTLDPTARFLLVTVLKLTREALPFIPDQCQFYLLGQSRDMRYELRQALDAFEDHLEREGEGFC